MALIGVAAEQAFPWATRLSAIYDEIVAMPDGYGTFVAEYGSHDELMERAGLYAVLWKTQKLS